MAEPSKTSIMCFSGKYFDPLNPHPDAVNMSDIDRGLRRRVRFGGQAYDLRDTQDPLSITAHSMRVGRYVFWRLVGDVDASKTDRVEAFVLTVLAALIHDTPEGYVGDELGPIKTTERKALEALILAAIAEALVGQPAGMFLCNLVHNDGVITWADNLALRTEALICSPGGQDWALPGSTPVHPYSATRDDIATNLHLFHPREGEDWRTCVELIAQDVRGFAQPLGRRGLMLGRMAEMLR